MDKGQQQKAAVGCNPTGRHQTDPPPRGVKEEFPAADSVPSETPAGPSQPEVGGEGTENRQGSASVSTPSQALQKPKSNRKSARDYGDSDILPMMRRNRERGQKTKATSIHKYLVRTYGPELKDQLRTTQRLVRKLSEKLDQEDKRRVENPNEPPPELFFPQDYGPGEVAQLDCSSLKSLGITIAGQPYTGMIFTFKLMYSKWIYACIVSGETEIEVLESIQDALWALKGVPGELRSDNGKALFTNAHEPNTGYDDLYNHYGTSWSTINPGHPNENGGAETGNKTVKGLLRDWLTTDVDPNFKRVEQLSALLKQVLKGYNAEVLPELEEERARLNRLPNGRVEPYELVERTINKEGCIRIDGRLYSAPLDLHATKVKVRKYADRLVIYDHDGKPAWEWPWATDTEGWVDFRHVIHWLWKKPGAFKRYRFKERMFPTESFRETHEKLSEWYESAQADTDYLSILRLATGSRRQIRQSQGGEMLINEVDCALTLLLEEGKRFNFSHVRGLVETGTESGSPEKSTAVRQQTLDYRTSSRR